MKKRRDDREEKKNGNNESKAWNTMSTNCYQFLRHTQNPQKRMKEEKKKKKKATFVFVFCVTYRCMN